MAEKRSWLSIILETILPLTGVLGTVVSAIWFTLGTMQTESPQFRLLVVLLAIFTPSSIILVSSEIKRFHAINKRNTELENVEAARLTLQGFNNELRQYNEGHIKEIAKLREELKAIKQTNGTHFGNAQDRLQRVIAYIEQYSKRWKQNAEMDTMRTFLQEANEALAKLKIPQSV